jgi:hypothetical protein
VLYRTGAKLPKTVAGLTKAILAGPSTGAG